MADRSHMSDESLNAMLAQYGLGELVEQKAFSTGTVQENILVKSEQGIQVLKHYKTRSRAYVEFEIALIEYLIQNDFCCPGIYKNKQGEQYLLRDNRVIVFYEYVEGEHKEALNDDELSQLIEKIAELHILTRSLNIKGYENRWNYGIDFCRNYIKSIRSSDREKRDWFLRELNQLDLPTAIAKGVIHGDLDKSNLLFKNGELVAIIDFDDSNYSYLLLDIISLINNKCENFLEDEYFHAAGGIIRRYSKIRKLEPKERQHLFDVLRLSILIDCLWFFERGHYPHFKEKEKMDRLNKLGRDNYYNRIFSSS